MKIIICSPADRMKLSKDHKGAWIEATELLPVGRWYGIDSGDEPVNAARLRACVWARLKKDVREALEPKEVVEVVGDEEMASMRQYSSYEKIRCSDGELLRMMEEMSMEEIGKVFGCTRQAVNGRVKKARARKKKADKIRKSLME